MATHKNFYETIQEARMRLKNTIVQYKDNFYFVLAIGDHMSDGKFRIYMDQLGYGSVGRNRLIGFPSSEDYGTTDYFTQLDNFLEKNPGSGVVRKFADSRHFQKFRPFPLGNVNQNGSVVYTERTPTRSIQQGLLVDAVLCTQVASVPVKLDPHKKKLRGISFGSEKPYGNAHVDLFGPFFYDMLMNRYPSYEEVVENLRDPEIMNSGCAFHRDYSIMRGPLDTLILCHKHCGVGMIDSNNVVTIGNTHEFLKEEIAELGVFSGLNIKEIKNNA